MSKKERLEYRRQKEAERRAQPSALDVEMLDLMGRLRRYTFGAELGDSPRHLAARKLMAAIDEMAGAVTGDPEHFFTKHHSIG